MATLMGEVNWVSDFKAFFWDLEGFFSLLGIRSFTTNQCQTPSSSLCHRDTMPETRFVHPQGSLALNTLVPDVEQLARKNWFNAMTAGQLRTTQKIPQGLCGKVINQPHFTQVDKFKLKLSSVTAQVASCTSAPGLGDPSFPSAKETNGENVSGFISDPHF